MIISRSPFRITLAGGGTDLPSFYEEKGGEVVSMAINRYIYVSYKENLIDPKIRLQYLQTEVVDKPSELSHERARAVLEHFKIGGGCEISSVADLPSKSGLGSSGSYLVGLINCIAIARRLGFSKFSLADLACQIEMDTLNLPVGKQDQFISAYGGLQTLSIDKEGVVTPIPFPLERSSIDIFTRRCRLYYTGIHRNASQILESQTVDKGQFNGAMQEIAQLGPRFKSSLLKGDFDEYGLLLRDHWRCKRSLSGQMTTSVIDDIYSHVLSNHNVLGGKVVGAGGGGFLLLYAQGDPSPLDHFMASQGMPRIPYGVDFNGVTTLHISQDNN